MAKVLFTLVASLIFVLALSVSATPAHHAHAHAHAHSAADQEPESFTVEGIVYCDTCRVMFPTRISNKLGEAEVKLTCRGAENGTTTYEAKGHTQSDGTYSLMVSGDHEDEICEVSVVSSPESDCNEVADQIKTARVTLTRNSGIQEQTRYVNPIGFVRKNALTDCLEVLDELGFVPINN
ncbi:hypothetical protein NMG60_11036978 [Bertholletia excelsa]